MGLAIHRTFPDCQRHGNQDPSRDMSHSCPPHKGEITAGTRYCLQSEYARALQCKAPRVTHSVASLLPVIKFHMEDPDCVNNTMNIFQFPYLSLFSVSEASIVTKQWDKALDANTMMYHANSVALMKQQSAPPPPHLLLVSSIEDSRAVASSHHCPHCPTRAPSIGILTDDPT